MALLLTLILPIFIVILAGYITAWRGLIDKAGVRGLTGFVYYFALPLLLFHLFANAPLTEEFNGVFVLVYLVAGLAIHLTGLLTARWVFGSTWPEQAIQGMAVSFGNTVFIALPISIGLFGDAAHLPVLLAIIIENGVLMPLTIVLLEIGRSGRIEPLKALRAAATAVLRNPIVMPIVPGAAVAVFGLELPAILDETIQLVRGAAVPCALFALGATLAGLPIASRKRQTSFVVATKLVAFPLLVWGLLSVFVPDLDPVWKWAGTIAAAGPVGANVFLIASRYDAYLDRASAAVFLATALSILTLSLIVLAAM